MNIPASLHYTKEHEWVRRKVDGQSVVVGITDYAQGELGDIVFVELEPEGEEFVREAVFGSVEAVKAVSELFMPVSGTIIACNPALDSNPELVNEDPYGEGWMIEVALHDLTELDELLSSEAYEAIIA